MLEALLGMVLGVGSTGGGLIPFHAIAVVSVCVFRNTRGLVDEACRWFQSATKEGK